MNCLKGLRASIAALAAATIGLSAFAQTDPIVVGATVPLTGQAAMTGAQYHNSLKLAEEDINKTGGINGRPLKIVFQDSGTANATAVNAFVKVVQESKPRFVFLSSYSTHNMAVSPEVEKAAIPVMYAGGIDAVADLNNKWMFRIRPAESIAAKAMVAFAKSELKATKPGILYVQNEAGQDGARVIAAELEATGTAVVAKEAYAFADKDFSAQLLRLREKGADVILMIVYPQDGALILRQAKTLGIKVPIISSSASFVPAALQLVSPADLVNVYGAYDVLVQPSVGGRVGEFARRYKDKFGIDADPFGLAYYDGAMLMAEGMRKVGLDANAIRDWLASVRNWPGIGHEFSFNERREGVHDVSIIKAKPGTKELEMVRHLKLR